jgi:hypothetical protein
MAVNFKGYKIHRLVHIFNVLQAMLDDRSITTVCKVIGGLSADGLLINFDVIGNSIACLNIWQMGSPSLTFRKNITDKQSFNRANNGSTTHTNKWRQAHLK